MVVTLAAVEGAAWLLGDLDDRAHSAEDWRIVLDTVRATETVPELLGVSPHLLAVARAPFSSRRGFEDAPYSAANPTA